MGNTCSCLNKDEVIEKEITRDNNYSIQTVADPNFNKQNTIKCENENSSQLKFLFKNKLSLDYDDEEVTLANEEFNVNIQIVEANDHSDMDNKDRSFNYNLDSSCTKKTTYFKSNRDQNKLRNLAFN